MTLIDEKQAFSRRLRDSLRRVEADASTAAGVAREFNLRYDGTPVTAQAVRKWLAGKALPSQDKIRALARWLEVSPHWLRFGETEPKSPPQATVARQDAAAYRVDAGWLAKRFDSLSERHKKLVVEVVIALLRFEGKS